MAWGQIRKTAVVAFKNKYVYTAIFFIVWLLVFDGNDLISSCRLSQKVRKLEAERDALKESIEQDRRKMDELKSSREKLEKFAREEYYMKRDDEVVFIVR